MSLIFVPPGSGTPGDLVTDDTQIEWDGLLLGVDTYFGYKSLVGWDDLPGADDASSPRPHAHGSFPGAMYSGSRVITLETQVWSMKDWFPALRREFLLRTQFEQEEKPLIIQQHGEKLQAWARVTARSWPINRAYFGGYPIASVQWTCSDPRRYSLSESSIRLDPPASSGGLPWDVGLDWTPNGLSWGTQVTGAGSINNEGTAETPLTFEFNGPLTPPYFVNAPGNWSLGFNLPLIAGEILVVDTRLDTVTLQGIDRYYALHPSSHLPVDCVAPPGVTSVQLVPGAPSDTGFVDISWRNAQM